LKDSINELVFKRVGPSGRDLLQDNPLSFSGYTPEELESFLDNLKDSINELVFKRVGPSGREETELSFGTDRTFATGLKVPGEEGKLVEGNPAEASKDINEVLLPEELVPGENKAGAEMEDGAQPIISEREETEGPVPTSIYLAEARLEEAAGDEKLSLAKGNSPVEESSIEDMRKGNTTAGIAATAEGNNEVITADMKAGQEELTTEPKFFRIENQNYNHNHNLDTEDKSRQDNGNNEGQSAYFMDRSSWLQHMAGTGSRELPQTTQVDMESIIEQISSRMQVQRQAGKNRIELQLEPESLGRVRLELEVENTELTARILVDNEQVRSHLEQNLDSLRSSLLRQGFNVGEIQIESRELAHQEQYYPQQEFQQPKEDDRRNRKDRNSYLVEELEALEGIGEAIRLSEFNENDDSIAGPPGWVHLNYSRHRMNLLA
ncbi:MAG: flagellar hook-length control protein FliK, partial [Halanaerobiales bacterium]